MNAHRGKKAVLKSCCVGAAVAFIAGTAHGNAELMKLQQDPNQWVMWGGKLRGTRYSELDQINTENVSNSAGRLDLLDRRAARSRRRAAGYRRHDVCPYAVPEQRSSPSISTIRRPHPVEV